VAGEVVDKQSRLWVRVEQLVGRAAEEAAVRIKRRLYQLRHELTEDTAAVDARLIHAGKVHQSNLHLQLQVRLCTSPTDRVPNMLHILWYRDKNYYKWLGIKIQADQH